MHPQISRLIYRSILGTISEAEKAELDEWMNAHPDNAELVSRLHDPVYLEKERKFRRKVDTRHPAADMQRRVNAMKARRVAILSGCAAAVCALIWCATLLFRGSMAPVSVTAPVAHDIVIDSIKPGRPVAKMVTPTGATVTLDSLNIAAMPVDATMPVSAKVPVTAPEQLCLDVPRGGEFKIVLSDSTVVWLNSESQLRFPETFAANERRVSISGEAYFEVKKDPSRPFYVESAGQVVQVYGTRFDIKAYPDEETVYTTLEEGCISLRRLDHHGGELFLVPGQQALYNLAESDVEMKEVKTSVITGWRHGRFVFEEQTLASIMRDLSRWYDFEYEITDPSLENDVFLGSVPRYSDFRSVISILEKCGDISFSTSGDKVIISPR